MNLVNRANRFTGCFFAQNISDRHSQPVYTLTRCILVFKTHDCYDEYHLVNRWIMGSHFLYRVAHVSFMTFFFARDFQFYFFKPVATMHDSLSPMLKTSLPSAHINRILMRHDIDYLVRFI
jgi:hypothetical protein